MYVSLQIPKISKKFSEKNKLRTRHVIYAIHVLQASQAYHMESSSSCVQREIMIKQFEIALQLILQTEILTRRH